MPKISISFEKLVKECRPSLEKTARGYFPRDPALCEDAVSEAITSALKKFDTFDGNRATFKTWIQKILKNKCINEVRDRIKQARFVEATIVNAERENSWYAIKDLETGEVVEQGRMVRDPVTVAEDIPGPFREAGDFLEPERPVFGDEVSHFIEEHEDSYFIVFTLGENVYSLRQKKPFNITLFAERIKGTPHKEIAKMLGKKTGAVDVAMHKMMKKITP